jgi:hypothetical protein
MRCFGRRLVFVLTIMFVSMVATVLVTPAVSSAACVSNMSRNPVTNECKQPTAPPAWYTPPPAYAPAFAGQDVPPPPPWPWWSPVAPTWQVGFHQWGLYLNGVWVPL